MSERIKILLVNAINTDVEVETRYANLGLAYLAAALKNAKPGTDFEIRIIDNDVENTLKSFKPALAGVSCVSQNFNIAGEYLKLFSASGVPAVLGGVHITALPQTLPKTALAGCLGEGEITFCEIVKKYLAGAVTPKDLYDIKGLAFWDDGRLQLTEPRPPAAPLDAIAMPDRELLPIGSHTYMFTSRGCPYRCVFCSSSRFWDKLRFFSAEYVVREIKHLVETYNVTMISFFDDLFTADRDRLQRIRVLLEKENLIGKVAFTCSCRANTVDPQLARLLSGMGFVSVGMGLESGAEATLKYLKCGSVSVRDNYNAVKILKANGIAANASFVIGSPQETPEQILETYAFIAASGLDLFDVYLLTPYPGTPVWEYAKSRNLVSDDMKDWSVLNVNAYRQNKKDIICLSERLTKEQLLGYYNKFRRLRLYWNLKKVLAHPMKSDLPRMALRIIRERFYNIFRRRG